MIKLAVAGSPIGHSLSPLLHSTAYEILGVKAEFGSNDVKEQDFGNYYFECKNAGFRGLALTMPLKEISIGFVDRVDPIAKQISSVNTIIFESTGSIGISTDLLAFKNLLKPYFGKKIAILGAGGTARAIAASLDGIADSITVLGRTSTREESFERIVSHSKFSYVIWSNALSLEPFSLVVNTTPAGAADLLAEGIEGDISCLLFDVIYKPWPTVLAKKWNNLGAPVISGVELLLYQGIEQLRIVTDKNFDTEKLASNLREKLATAL